MAEKTKEQVELEKKISEIVEDRASKFQALSELDQQRIDSLNIMIDSQKKLLASLQTESEFAKEQAELAKKSLNDLNTKKATQEEINEAEEEASEKKIASMKAEYELKKAILGIEDDYVKNLRQAIVDAEKARKAEKKHNKEIEESKKKQLELSDALTGGLVSQIKGYFTFAGQLKNISEIFNSIAKGNVDFARTTGQIADRTATFGLGASQFGIGFEEMNKAAMNLYTSMSGFSELNKQTQEGLALSTAKLELLGVSAETSGRNMDILMKTFRMTADEAIRSNEELARAAIGAGIAPSKMLAGFAEAMPRLAAYGKQAIQVFTDLQKQAKSLGLEVSNLINIVGDQMDTFEGAARAAGKFNAVMGGGYLNSIELLNATESERVLILKRAFEQTGKNFDSLSKFEKKAIAATLGIQDLNEATKLFSKSSSELAMDQAKNAASQERLEAVQREAAETTKQIKEAFNGLLIVIRPIVAFVKNIVDVLTLFASMGGGVVGVILSFTAAFFGLRKALEFTGGFNKTTAILTGIALAFQAIHYWFLEPHSPILYLALLALPPMIFAIGEAADANEKSLLALGAAVAMIGAGVYMAASGLAELVKSFQGLGDAAPYAAAAVGVFSLAFFGMMAMLISLVAGPQAVLTGAAIGVLLSIGGAIALIGAGVGIAAAGLGSLVSSFGVFSGDKGASIAENISATTGALTMMITTLTGVGAVGLLAISGITIAVAALVEELNKIPEGKVLSLETFDNTLKTVKTLKDSDLEPTRKLVTVVKDYYTEQAKSKDADKDAFVVALREVMGEFNKGATATAAEGGAIPIKLVIADGKEFAASIVESAGSPRLATALGGKTLSRRGF